jgi:hypothetical protein
MAGEQSGSIQRAIDAVLGLAEIEYLLFCGCSSVAAAAPPPPAASPFCSCPFLRVLARFLRVGLLIKRWFGSSSVSVNSERAID